MAKKTIGKSNNKAPKKAPVKDIPFEVLEKKKHADEIRGIFKKSGFTRVPHVEDKEFTFKGRTGDIDDVFLYDNIIILAEYTCSKSKNISDHLLKKKVLFDHIANNNEEFILFLEDTFPTFKQARDNYFDIEQCKIIILYASKNDISITHKEQVPYVIYLDYTILNYFIDVTNTIKLTSRYELFKFLGLNYSEVGRNALRQRPGKGDLDGFILPESFSNFPKGYKVVTFYIDPESLLSKSYVLRKDGWRTEGGLYQRMINSKKINSIRKYLVEHKRVFINNIIVTLPSSTKILNTESNTIDPATLKKTEAVIIQLPDNFDTVGLIDGQHRVYAYYEGGSNEEEIKRLREKQNLLVTGIIYPPTTSEITKTQFEANLFLEINSNQTSPRTDLKQDIELILKPFSTISISKAVIHRLNNAGALENMFAKFQYDKDKIKTSSIVSFALVPILKQSGSNSLYYVWNEPDKEALKNATDENLLKNYINYGTTIINTFLGSVKKNVTDERWTASKQVHDKILSVTSINAFIICLRYIVESGEPLTSEYFDSKLKKVNDFDFSRYKSSQYGKMGKDLYNTFFVNTQNS